MSDPLREALFAAMKSVKWRTNSWPIYLRISYDGDVEVSNTDGGTSMGWAGDTQEEILTRTKACKALEQELRTLYREMFHRETTGSGDRSG